MRYSHLFGKTVKTASKDASAVSHQLLYRAGFIRESTAGRYYLLPLGLRVHQKIQKIIKEEMDMAGAQEMITPVLHPKHLWRETNRTKTVGFELMTVKDRNRAEFVLGGTAEEMLVDLVRKFQISYKDLPFNLYQFSTKFRDEMRARGGLLRVREFMMKDAYSFHAGEEDFKKEYENMKQAYSKIFTRVGLSTVIVESDNGYIGGDYCHEFVVENESGESRYYISSDRKSAFHEEIAAKKGISSERLKNYYLKRGIEVGNVFQLGLHYSGKMTGACFVDKNGKERPYYMGCYGIGLGRAMATAVEIHHDEKGIVWPESVAPYQVHLIHLGGVHTAASGAVRYANGVYNKLSEEGFEVLYDDREAVSAGEKFADADLIGIPVRLVISSKTEDKIEWKRRNEEQRELISFEELVLRLQR